MMKKCQKNIKDLKWSDFKKALVEIKDMKFGWIEIFVSAAIAYFVFFAN